jgi:hypothetical protein
MTGRSSRTRSPRRRCPASVPLTSSSAAPPGSPPDRYQTKPDQANTNAKLVEAVYTGLHRTPDGVSLRYVPSK